MMVEVKFKRWKYRGKQTTVPKLFRVVAVLNKETGDYHVYMTNIPVERLSAEDISSLYGARWEIEMISEGIEELLLYGPNKQRKSRYNKVFGLGFHFNADVLAQECFN